MIIRECDVCGVQVVDVEKHQEFHRWMNEVSKKARAAYAMDQPIGGSDIERGAHIKMPREDES